jgi:hypothetical protein
MAVLPSMLPFPTTQGVSACPAGLPGSQPLEHPWSRHPAWPHLLD